MQCLPIETLIKEWTDDSVIDDTEPGKELLRIPKLHAKYVSQITAHSIALKMKEFEHRVLYKKKVEYYNGRMDQKQLAEAGWEPFKFILKSDISVYLNGDKDLIASETKQIGNREAIAFCQACVKELNNRTWQIKEHSTWERFIAGQH